MKLGIFAKTFPGDKPQDVLAAVAAAGFGAAQYNMACSGLAAMPDAIADDVAQAVGTASEQCGVSIVAVSGTYNMVHPDPAVRLSGHRRLEAIAAASAAMSNGLITLCTGSRDAEDQWRHHPDNDSPAAWADLVESMRIAVDIADRHGIDLGVEPELGNVVNSALKARRLIDEIGSRRIKIVLDPANLFEAESLVDQRRIVAQAVNLLASSITLAHAKDRLPSGEFTVAGRGVLDYPHYLSLLGDMGFSGALVTHGLAAADADEVAKFLNLACERARIGLDS